MRRAREPHIRVSYQCSPYHTNSPLYPAIQQLTFAAGIRPDDSNDHKLDRLERALVGEEGDRPLLGALLGLDTEARYGKINLRPQQQRVRTQQALVSQLMTLARDRPVLFVLEDAHWIDATTLDLVDLCLNRVASTRVMMLVTARPTFQHDFGGHPIATKLALNRLGRDEVRTIIDGAHRRKDASRRPRRSDRRQNRRRAAFRRGDHQDGARIRKPEGDGFGLRAHRALEPSRDPLDAPRFVDGASRPAATGEGGRADGRLHRARLRLSAASDPPRRSTMPPCKMRWSA